MKTSTRTLAVPWTPADAKELQQHAKWLLRLVCPFCGHACPCPCYGGTNPCAWIRTVIALQNPVLPMHGCLMVVTQSNTGRVPVPRALIALPRLMA